MYAILASLPIVLAIVMMLVLKQPASRALFAAWALSAVIAMAFWGLAPAHTAAYTVLGFVSAIDVMLIIFSAIFLLNVLLEIDFVKTIGNGFNGISQDRRIQIIIIAWMFGFFLEGAAGFGTPAAIAAPLLTGLGVPVFFAALASLIANGVPPLFGAAGTPTSAGFGTINAGLIEQLGVEGAAQVSHQVNTTLGLINLFTGSFIPFIMIAAIVARDGRKRGIKDAVAILPLCLLAGLAINVPLYMMTFLGSELPVIVGALVGIPVFIFAVKKGIFVPKEVYRFQDDPIIEQGTGDDQGAGVSLLTAWSPYAIISVVLVLTRLPQLPFFGMIRNPALILQWHGILGFEGINWNWIVLNNPGLVPFLPISLIYLMVYAKKQNKQGLGKKVLTKTLKQLKNAAIALFFGVALVQIMRFTDYSAVVALAEGAATDVVPMTTAMATALAGLFGGVYPLITPLIGVLGAFVSGSHTVSNIMFYGLQLETAELLGISGVIVLVGQTFGGAMGNMVAINNVVAVAATTNAVGQENKLIIGALVPMLIFSLAVSVAMFLLIAAGGAIFIGPFVI